jgi:hypothetical protein
MVSTFTKRWALVENGVIVQLADAVHEAGNPFTLADNQRAVDVTGVVCYEGYVVDSKGNVSLHAGSIPPVGDAPAYHDRSNPPALPTATQMMLLQTSAPYPIAPAENETFPVEVADD